MLIDVAKSLNSHLAAFEDFLKTFKSSASTTEASATRALQGLHIDEDGLSDEYDFMDDAGEREGVDRSAGQNGRARDPKLKYMEILQSVADRLTSEICIELDDLDAVGLFFL
jgi:DNA replication licensing factor MCM7